MCEMCLKYRMGYVIIPKPNCSNLEGINSRCCRFDLLLFRCFFIWYLFMPPPQSFINPIDPTHKNHCPNPPDHGIHVNNYGLTPLFSESFLWRRSGSAVECRTLDRGNTVTNPLHIGAVDGDSLSRCYTMTKQNHCTCTLQ